MRNRDKSRTSEVAEGLQIIEKYLGGEKFSIGAKHDEIYAGYNTPARMSPEDKQKMLDLGWHGSDGESWVFFP